MQAVLMFLVFFCFSFISLSVVASTRTLTFSTVANAEINTVNQQLLAEAYRRLGFEIEVKFFPARRALIESDSGRVDGELYRIAGLAERYRNLVMVPTSISVIDWMLFAHNKTLRTDDWHSLKPYTIAVERGVIYAEQKTETMRRELANDNLQMMKMLHLGRVELVLDTRLDGLATLRTINAPNIHMLEPPVERVQLYHYLHRRHEGLVPQLDLIFQELKREGLADKLMHDAMQSLLGKR